MSLGYGWQKLYEAVHGLTGAVDQKERLVNAIMYSLIHVRPEENLPPEMRDDFARFMKSMTSVAGKGDEGSVQATVNSLDELGVRNAVEKIVDFYDTICRYQDPH